MRTWQTKYLDLGNKLELSAKRPEYTSGVLLNYIVPKAYKS